VELGPRRQHLKVLEGGTAKNAVVHTHLLKIGVRNDTPPELWAESVDNGKVGRVLVPHGTGVSPVGTWRGEEGNKRGTRHLHVGNLAATGS
jgi:hypothetical protein